MHLQKNIAKHKNLIEGSELSNRFKCFCYIVFAPVLSVKIVQEFFIINIIKIKQQKMNDHIKQLEAIINVMQAQIKQQQIQIDYLMQHIHDTDTYEDIEGKYQFV